VSCPAPSVPPGEKRRDTARGPRVTSRPPAKKNSEKPKPATSAAPAPLKSGVPPEPGTGRYAKLAESNEELVLARPRAKKMTLRGSSLPAPKKSSVRKIIPHIAKTDLGDAKIGPREAFVLSRIDGALAVEELADLVGMNEGDVREILARLERLGLVRL
jgi:hypothetical protein